MRRIATLVVVLFLGYLSGGVAGQSGSAAPAAWPGFRGPSSSGISTADDAAPVTFAPGSPQMQWKIDLPEGHSSPVVWGDQIFITGVDRAAKRLEVFGIDRVAGKIAWRRDFVVPELEFSHAVGNPASATPATDGERVYAYFGSLGLVALDLKGNEMWRVPLPVVPLPFGNGTSPLVVGNVVVLSREGSDQYLLAVDKRTGATVWKHEHAGHGCPAGHASPIAWKDVVVLNRCGEVVAVDLANGQRRWWLEWGSGSGDTTPVIVDDRLYATAWDNLGEPDLLPPTLAFEEALKRWDKDANGVLSQAEFPDLPVPMSARVDAGNTQGAAYGPRFPGYDTNKNGSVDAGEWASRMEFIRTTRVAAQTDHGLIAIRPAGAGALARSAVVWAERRSVAEVPSPLAYRQKVYMVTNGGVLSALRATTGELVYRARLGAPGLYFSSPVASGGRIYFGSGEGVLTVISAGDSLEVLARNDFGDPIIATPAIVSGHIYVRTTKALFGFRDGR